jgi:hypothetical protein
VPGLAVDPAGRHAYLVGDGVVADADLTSLDVSYRTPARPVSLLGPTRTAYWLGDGRIAVAGSDVSGRRVRPAGLSVLDTRDWSVRAVDGQATDVRVTRDLLLAGRADGVVAYGLDGERRFRLPGAPWVEQVYGGRAYVWNARFDALHVVDLATGRAAGRSLRTLPNLLLHTASSAWDSP